MSRFRRRGVGWRPFQGVVRRLFPESCGRAALRRGQGRDRARPPRRRRGVCGRSRCGRREDRGEYACRRALGGIHDPPARHREARHVQDRGVHPPEALGYGPSAPCVPRNPPVLVPGGASAADGARDPPRGASEVQLRDCRAVGNVREQEASVVALAESDDDAEGGQAPCRDRQGPRHHAHPADQLLRARHVRARLHDQARDARHHPRIRTSVRAGRLELVPLQPRDAACPEGAHRGDAR